MQARFMIVGAVALVALSAGVPGMLGGGPHPEPTPPRSLALDVQIIPENEFDEGAVVATLVLDQDAPVVEVSMSSDATTLFFSKTGEDGMWVAEGALEPGVDCYPVTAQVTLATVGAAPTVPASKVKKAKKVKKVKSKKAEPDLPTKAAKVKKAKKSKKAEAGFEAVMGAMVLEVTAESCLYDEVLPD